MLTQIIECKYVISPQRSKTMRTEMIVTSKEYVRLGSIRVYLTEVTAGK